MAVLSKQYGAGNGGFFSLLLLLAIIGLIIWGIVEGSKRGWKFGKTTYDN